MKVITLGLLMVLSMGAQAADNNSGFFNNFFSGSESAKGEAEGQARGKFKMEFDGGATGHAEVQERATVNTDSNASARSSDK